jgi:hypothetical protein
MSLLDEIAGVVKPHNDLIIARGELEVAAALLAEVAMILDGPVINMPVTAKLMREHAERARNAAARCTGTMS